MKNQNLKSALICLLLISFSAFSLEPITDGPYVFEQSNQRNATWICNGEKVTRQISRQTPQIISQCGLSATLWQANPKEEQKLEYSGKFKIAAASDIHGQFDLFIKLLKNNEVLDQAGKWNFANGHFVITGDIFDRGPQVIEALWFLYDLEKQAEKAGGKLHLLLGNHEVMVLNGDLRYLHEKYNKTALLLDRSYESLFSKESVLGDWLRSRPVLIKVNGMLFTHGGFHPKLAKEKISLKKINQTFKSSLVEKELEKPREGLANYLHGKNGPIWYRGYFEDDGASAKEIKQLLKHFQVSHIIVGHTTQDSIETRYKGKVIEIDAAMKEGLNGEVLFWENGKFSRGLLSGEKRPLTENLN